MWMFEVPDAVCLSDCHNKHSLYFEDANFWQNLHNLRVNFGEL